MVESVSRELILPALRLDVPSRPSEQQVAAFAERSPDAWTTTPLDWATQQVVRLAVAAVLSARVAQAGPPRSERPPLPTDPEQVTLAQLATRFRPHVGLAAQAFTVAVVDSVNAGVPAAVDPVREGLRRLGITGRDTVRMVALGLDKLPARARPEFWDGVRGSSTLTAVVDALATGSRPSEQARARDVSGLDRSQLARADALVLAGGRITPVSFGTRREAGQGSGSSWLHVPLSVGRQRRGRPDEPRRGGERVVEVGLRSEGWVEVFETALDAVGQALQAVDLGSRPRGGRGGGSGGSGGSGGHGGSGTVVDALVPRLVAARGRTVAEVVASLRDVDPFVLEMYDHQVTTTSVPVAVPVVEDDLFVQLWLPTSALAGPLFTGAVDLFLGAGAEHRVVGGAGPDRPAGRPAGRPARKAAPSGPAAAPGGAPEGDRRPREGSRRGKRRPAGGRPAPEAGGRAGVEAPSAPDVALPASDVSAPTPAPAPGPAPAPTPEPTPAPAPAPFTE